MSPAPPSPPLSPYTTLFRSPVVVDRDEPIREETTVEALGALRPAFKQDGSVTAGNAPGVNDAAAAVVIMAAERAKALGVRSEEHTSELQSPCNLVCRLLLEK